jgi:hypothetical protein
MKIRSVQTVILAGLLLLSSGCSSCYRLLNDRFVERIGAQLQSGNYEQIYNESAQRAKDYKYSKTEFIERMKTIAAKLREVDESLTLQKHKGPYPYADEGAFPPSRYAYRYVEKNNKKIGINISIEDIGLSLSLMDFCIYSEENSDIDQLCVSEAGKS